MQTISVPGSGMRASISSPHQPTPIGKICKSSRERRRYVPEAMWFCFFSSSVRRGLSSPLALAPSADDAELLFGDDDMMSCQ